MWAAARAAAVAFVLAASSAWAATATSGSEVPSGLFKGSGTAGDTAFHLDLWVRGSGASDAMDWSLKGGDVKISCRGEAFTTEPSGIDVYEVVFNLTTGDCLHDAFATANVTAGAPLLTYDVSQEKLALSLTVGADALRMELGT